MRKSDLNKVVFYSKKDMAGASNLRKGEHILKSKIKDQYEDINEILELYNIKKYLDNELYLDNWTDEEIEVFKLTVVRYDEIIGRFISEINDDVILDLYYDIIRNYVNSFWELINNREAYKRISRDNFKIILEKEPYLINTILLFQNLVNRYKVIIKDFLFKYSKSAEILLSIYEEKDNFKKKKFIPKNLTLQDKENIISNYLDSNDTSLNYLGLIQNVRNNSDFRISDKVRLKAKRLYKSETKKFFTDNAGIKYGVSISFKENVDKAVDGYLDDNLYAHYIYSLDFIEKHKTPYFLFQNFKYLFEYLDNQNRINLVSKESELGLFEKIMGVRSKNEYRIGTSFSLSETTSQYQIFAYSKVLNNLGESLEDLLHFIFTSEFQEKFNFANNARFLRPTGVSYLEKIRSLAPEFESVLKQFKLFVEDGNIDFELLQMSSSPTWLKSVPSLNKDKYIYLNKNNEVIINCINIFFSDQTILSHVEPFIEDQYLTFFDLITSEEVKYSNYEDYQKPSLDYLINNMFIYVDSNDLIQIKNIPMVLIIKDLYDNEVGSYYHYPKDFQKEAQKMAIENIIEFQSSLFSKPEQSYFNYFLNKKEFTNGLDLRNSYLHGTQADPEEIQKHQYAYFTYLKLIFLTLLKIDDDLHISKIIKNNR